MIAVAAATQEDAHAKISCGPRCASDAVPQGIGDFDGAENCDECDEIYNRRENEITDEYNEKIENAENQFSKRVTKCYSHMQISLKMDKAARDSAIAAASDFWDAVHQRM